MQKYLETAPPKTFPGISEQKANAAHFLFKTFGSDDESSLPPAMKQSKALAESLFADYPNWLKDKNQLEKIAADPRLQKINTSWMNELYKFDHINMLEIKEFNDKIQGVSKKNPFSKLGVWTALPLSPFSSTSLHLKIYFLQSYKNNSVQEAFKLSRHLSHLLFQSKEYFGILAGIANINMAYQFADTIKIHSEYPIPTPSKVNYLKFIYAWAYYLNSNILAAKPFDAKKNADALPFICAAAKENLKAVILAQGYLFDHFPFEINLTKNVDATIQTHATLFDACERPQLKGFIQYKNQERIWVDLPFIRQALGLYIIADLIEIDKEYFEKFYFQDKNRKLASDR
ncbi:MAG: hypothetical protein ACOYOK_04585 [Pseudobdellovibrionaceae bacterium]